jgi:hypothetical protein
MPTLEQLRAEELESLERERAAFERRQTAFFAIHHQSLPYGNGALSSASLNELEYANKEWREASAVIDRIAADIRSGKRR